MSKTVHQREFWCETCGQKEPSNAALMIQHLKTVHGLDVFRGRKKTRMCVDEKGFYQNVYDWTLPGKVRLTEISSGPRGR